VGVGTGGAPGDAGGGKSPPSGGTGATAAGGGAVQPPGGGGAPAGASATEVDPGTDGDGEFHVLPPYNNQPAGLTRGAGVPAGQVLGPMNFASTTIYPGRSFPIQIYVPAQYTKAKPAALMVTQDGRQWVGRFPIIYDNLIAAGKAPITINLFIPASTPADRSDEYDTVSGKYGDFIMNEVLPWVKGMGYNITDDPAGRAATGNSSGGIAAFSIAWFKPEHFHRVLTSSGTFRNIGGKGGDMYPMTVMNAPMSPLRVFFSSSEGDMPGWLDANRAMSNALMAKGNHVRFIWGDSSIPHGGGAMLNQDLPFAMEWLWRGYKPAD
jgi:enterochelin esterase family protein